MILIQIAILLIMSALLFWAEEKKNKFKNVILGVFLVLFTLFAVFRSTEIPDTIEYIEIFNTGSVFANTWDWGFRLILLIGLLFKSYRVMFFLVVAFNMCILALCIRKMTRISKCASKTKVGLYCVSVFLLFISFYGMYYNFIVIRMGSASLLLIYAWLLWCDEKDEKRYVKAAIAFVGACLMHRSALVGILGFVVLTKKFMLSKKQERIFIGAIGLIYFSRISYLLKDFILGILTNVIEGKYEYYIQNMKFDSLSISYRFVFNFLILVFMHLYDMEDTVFRRLKNVYILGMLIHACCWPIIWCGRITDFFICINVFLLPFVMNRLENKKLVYAGNALAVLANFVFISRIL